LKCPARSYESSGKSQITIVHIHYIQELITKGKANPNSRDNSGLTPLHIAATLGRLEIVNALVSNA